MKNTKNNAAKFIAKYFKIEKDELEALHPKMPECMVRYAKLILKDQTNR